MRSAFALALLLVFLLTSFHSSAHSACDNDANSSTELKAAVSQINQRALHPVEDSQIDNAKCKSNIPSPMKIEQWLNSYTYGDRKTNDGEHGIQFEDESPKLIELFDKMTTGERYLTTIKHTFKSSCRKVLCAVKELFGEKVGPQLLYMLGKYGMNGSSLTYGEDATLWREEELAPALQALEDLPPGILPLSDNMQFTRFERGSTLARYAEIEAGGTKCVGANAEIQFFDCHFQITKQGQTQNAFHELSHYVGEELGLDTMNKWNQLSGWEETTRPNGVSGFNTNWQATKEACIISGYGGANPIEDFAESMTAYRYNPDLLKESCPDKYKFLKSMVFSGIEYTEENLCREKIIENGITDKLKWHLDKLNYQFE